jgi:hypothetical protein
MSTRHVGPAAGVLILLSGFATACGNGGLEGRYYNSSTGEFALELQSSGKVEMQGAEGEGLTYEVKADTVFIKGGRGLAEGMYFLRLPNGDLSLEPLGRLTKNRPD